MKISTIYAAAFSVIALATLTIPTLAQSGGTTNPSTLGDRQKRKAGGENPLAQRFNKRIGARLNLTDEQKKKIRAIQKETRDRMLPILREEMTRIRATLTDAQKKQLAQAMQEARSKRGGAMSNGSGTTSGTPQTRRTSRRTGNGSTAEPPVGVNFS